ncbi:MAG: DNA-directed RNA polymerase subunit H [Desulfurococcales archaeon]|nr:DNA-directed RNA polymerase subunit H [Desulfurococcales archaeon]
MSPSRSKKVSRKILHHELVPKHEVLDIEEAAKLLKELGVEPHQLPHISVNDPVVRILNAKPGDIIRIRRKSEIAGETIFYRIVAAY